MIEIMNYQFYEKHTGVATVLKTRRKKGCDVPSILTRLANEDLHVQIVRYG
jgi:hypothetical protein